MSEMWTTDLARYEDGRRVEVADRTFEWWYFDTIMEDGSTCVVTFLNKPPFTSSQLRPILQLNISTPSGKVYKSEIEYPAGSYSAASDHCNVILGPNRVEGDLRTYKLYAEAKDEQGRRLVADLQLDGVVPGWRTGPYLRPEEAAKQWLGEQVVIPSGTVRGNLTYEGVPHSVTGTCYHDHQWGGPQMQAPEGNGSWYWGRARIGDHHIVFAQVLSGGGSPVGVLYMLARGTENDCPRMTYDDSLTDLNVIRLGPDLSYGIRVDWQTNQGKVELRLTAPREIASFNAGGYLRFLSTAELRSDFAGEIFSGTGNAIWEINVF